MASTLMDQLGDLLVADEAGIVRVPALVKGQLIRPPELSIHSLRSSAGTGSAAGAQASWFRLDGAQVLRRPVLDRSSLMPTGEDQFLIFPDLDPASLIETDLDELARGLYALPFREVLDYVRALAETLRSAAPALREAARPVKATAPLYDRMLDLVFDLLPELFDPEAMAEAVDRELGSPDAAGASFLDGWVPVSAQAAPGMTARAAERLFGPGRIAGFQPRLRAMPTRQLHITAGNSPLMPLVSMLRALASKGAAVVKSPADSTAPSALVGLAMLAVDPRHPITRHTSLAYWKGGDRRIEDVLFAPGAFDRLVVWGSAETVRSLGQRATGTRTVFLDPRYGVSFIGREAFSEHLEEIAVRAAVDTLIADQQACVSSLVHYLEATEEDALRYCRVLQQVLERWDRAMPHAMSRAALGRLRLLRRKEFLGGTWFENGRGTGTTSLVVYMPAEFDASVHPMCRCVVVRRLDRLEDGLRYLHPGVSAVGVYPEPRRLELLDAMASRGVSNIFPLGDCERVYAGMPHDGMRLLGELVRWTNA